MKPSAVLLSIGLLSSAFTAATVAGHLAWNSLTEVDTAPIAQSESAATSTQPNVQSVQPNQQPSQTVANVSTAPAPRPQRTAQSTVQQVIQQPTPQWSQPENDYLFDLSQALQPIERDRLRAADQIAIARNIQTWLAAGADYWGVREQFDATYRGSVMGNYAHNRDVYIRFATAHFAPDYLANVMQPPRVEHPAEFPWEGPVPYPHAETLPYPYPDPYGHPDDFPGGPYPYHAYPGPPYSNGPYPDQNFNQTPQAPQLPNVTEVAM
jgi:hypothetical protein